VTVAEPALPRAVGRTAERLASGSLAALCVALREGVPPASLPFAVATPHYRGVVEELVAVWSHHPDISAEALAIALDCAAERVEWARQENLSLVWSGPTTEAVPVRRSDQALLELVRAADKRLVVVSYAVYSVPVIADALVQAARGGVEVAVVLESAEESGGNVSYEMTAALGGKVAEHVTFYTWPAERRPRKPGGKLASLHAKCAVADERYLLVSSANLTDAALRFNMELGLLVREGPVPSRVQRHLEQLIARGELVPASRRVA